MRRSIRPALSLATVVVLGACSGASQSQPSAPPAGGSLVPSAAPNTASATQTEEAGGVTLAATWESPGKGVTFAIKLDNHEIDLDTVTLAAATLRNDRGDTLTAQPWKAPAGGHHREGQLTFDGDAAGFLVGAKWIELTLPPIGQVTEQPLRWSIPTT